VSLIAIRHGNTDDKPQMVSFYWDTLYITLPTLTATVL